MKLPKTELFRLANFVIVWLETKGSHSMDKRDIARREIDRIFEGSDFHYLTRVSIMETVENFFLYRKYHMCEDYLVEWDIEELIAVLRNMFHIEVV